MGLFEAIILSVISASTPLLLAASGELVVERAGVYEQLQATAHAVASDIAYARSLAVSNDSKYRFTFDLTENRYVLKHSGTNNLLDDLPDSALRRNDDPSTQQTHDLDDIPRAGQRVEIVAVYRMAGTAISVDTVEFGPLGSTTRTEQTVIWLGCGSGDERRYMPVSIDPVTGLAAVGDYQSSAP